MKILEFVQDGSGALSSTRLAFLLWAIVVLFVWAYTCITTGKIVTVDWSVVGIIATLMTGKVAQSFSSNDTTTPPK